MISSLQSLAIENVKSEVIHGHVVPDRLLFTMPSNPSKTEKTATYEVREDDNDKVVHGSADGKCLCMVVQTVASRKINHIHLDPKIYYTCHFFRTLLVILCMTGTSVCAKRPVLP